MMASQIRGEEEAAAAAAGGSSRDKVVAFLGPLASFSHQATKAAFPGDEWKLETVAQIKDIFEVVQAGRAAYGVVPFENSTHGPVTFTLDCLADRAGAYADLAVCGEVYLDVHHYLLGRRSASATQQDDEVGNDDGGEGEEGGGGPKGTPLTSLAHVERVYSHPQAFGQTAGFFGRFLRGVETVDVSSTSRAAEMAAADAGGRSAAVASRMAAGVGGGLEVLARCIEDREDNTTRFFVVRRRRRRQGGTEEEEEGGLEDGQGQGQEGKQEEGRGEEKKKKKYKTLVSFTVPPRGPGALADVLDAFRGEELDLTSINSVPSLIRPFQYLFFVEFEGSRDRDPGGRVGRALARVGEVAQGWRWLGSWEDRREG